MSTPTQAEILILVKNRYPKLSEADQDHMATVALRVMAEPQWARLNIKPLTAVKLASSRSRRKSF